MNKAEVLHNMNELKRTLGISRAIVLCIETPNNITDEHKLYAFNTELDELKKNIADSLATLARLELPL